MVLRLKRAEQRPQSTHKLFLRDLIRDHDGSRRRALRARHGIRTYGACCPHPTHQSRARRIVLGPARSHLSIQFYQYVGGHDVSEDEMCARTCLCEALRGRKRPCRRTDTSSFARQSRKQEGPLRPVTPEEERENRSAFVFLSLFCSGRTRNFSVPSGCEKFQQRVSFDGNVEHVSKGSTNCHAAVAM